MKPDSFQAFFEKFRADFANTDEKQKAIAIDGKELRGSFELPKSNLNLVTAFAHGARLSLGITQSAKQAVRF